MSTFSKKQQRTGFTSEACVYIEVFESNDERCSQSTVRCVMQSSHKFRDYMQGSRFTKFHTDSSSVQDLLFYILLS